MKGFAKGGVIRKETRVYEGMKKLLPGELCIKKSLLKKYGIEFLKKINGMCK